MNREIKFRAWDSIAGQMWEDVYFDGGHIYTIGPDGENASTMPRWDDNALMQFTGLKDKNGKEIYESDVVRLYDNNNGFFEVIFVNEYVGGWVLKHKDYDLVSLGARKIDKVEVIGNIYENKEILG